jgi:hypothetical protein
LWAFLGVVAYPAPVLACGGGGVTTVSEQAVVDNAQRIVISVTERGTTETIVQIGVPVTTADYGVLIPTPAEPTLDETPVSESALQALDKATSPTIVVEERTQEEDGCGCLPMAGGGDDDSTSAPGRGVSASEPTNIGPVTAVTLTATDETELAAWLADNGFIIPEDRQALLDQYVGAGRYFIAVKRNDSTAPGGPTSIGLHYTLQGDHRLLSLAFARLGAAPTVAFTLFLFAPELAFPSPPFQALTLNDLEPALLAEHRYADAVQRAVKAHGAKAFVVEGGSSTAPAPLSLPSGFVDKDAAFVRLSTVLAASDLTEDATFFTPGSEPIEHSRTIRVYGEAALPASVGLLGFVALAWSLRRRGRSWP